jgi:2-dehydro-3-deoxyphosphogluconate aldolase/(4S)-4-hydroxy-2-oxoglutarate aldolase
MVKVFPVSNVGGPRYVRALLDPIPDVPLCPTGGVDPDAARAYAELGCAGVGVGGALVGRQVVARQDWHALTELGRAFVAAWNSGAAAESAGT